MNAEEARKLTNEAKDTTTTPLLERCMAKMRTAAKKGYSATYVTEIFASVDWTTKNGVLTRLRALGYKVEEHSDQREQTDTICVSW